MKKGLAYNTRTSAKMLGVTQRTFRTHARLHRILGRKVPRHRGKFYTYSEILKIADTIYMPKHLWTYRLEDRLKRLREEWWGDEC